MRLNRLFEIVYVLLNEETVTAKRLAERLEVSVRTVYRDIELLSASGIPVYMSKGRGGGIRLLDGFVLNKSVLSEREQKEILSALHGLKTIRDPDAGAVLSRLGALFGRRDYRWVDVDFSQWGGRREDVFAPLKTAVIERRIVAFDYVGSFGGKSAREAEPLQLWFKNRHWYVKAWCRTRQAFRIFKLSRMRNVRVTSRTFERGWDDAAWPNPEDAATRPEVELTLCLAPSAAHRVYDEFDESEITKLEDGRFIVKVSFPEDEWVYGYVLSFGDQAEVLAPAHVRDRLRARLENMLRHYRAEDRA
jgi:predicted DNA-binding transcriptional regulator YafY